MIICQLTNSHAKEIADFFKANFSDGWTEEMILSAFSTGRFFSLGAYEQEDLIGVITYSMVDDSMDIEDVVVKIEYRKKSVASSLLASVFEKLDNTITKKVLLEVREGNIPAINLYKKFGFNQLSVRKKYYSDGENALVMIKEV